MRHNSLRDEEAKLMKEVCRDVQTEPHLRPMQNDHDYERGNTADNARLDISAIGLWNGCEKTFFDIRITHPTSPCYLNKTRRQLDIQHEEEKKRSYNDRVLEHEKATFCPLVFTTSGGMAPECSSVNKRLAEKLAYKRKESYTTVITYIRTKLRFALLRSTLAAVRGFRGPSSDQDVKDIQITDFSLIPSAATYEV